MAFFFDALQFFLLLVQFDGYDRGLLLDNHQLFVLIADDVGQILLRVEQVFDGELGQLEEFDVIWSEGAIYNIGFERGLQEWKKYLKRGGYIAVSEATWLTKSRPKEIEEYWNREYADINMAANRIKLIEDNGYSLVGYFVLKQSSWMKNYYEPIKNRLQKFLERHNNSESAKQLYESSVEEIEIYEKYKDYYSYGFYVAKKI